MPAPAISSPAKTARIEAFVSLLAATLMLLWPAFYNRLPLLEPDSMTYLFPGEDIARAILHPFAPPLSYTRSEFFELGLYFLHWHRFLWPVVIFNALFTASVLRAAARHLADLHGNTAFLLITGVLSATTGIAWHVSTIDADYTAVPCYLGILLVVFCWANLHTPERLLVLAAIAWGMQAHTTNWMVATGLCALFAIPCILRWQPMAGRGRLVAAVASLIAVTLLSQLAFHRVLYKRYTLSGVQPPYLMARILADGPGALYLMTHCSTLRWAICNHVGHLPTNDGDFLWAPGSIWSSATPAEQEQLRAEQFPLVLATLRAYPRAEAAAAFGNFRRQFSTLGSWESSSYVPYVGTMLPRFIPGDDDYAHSRTAAGKLFPMAWAFSLKQVPLVQLAEVLLLVAVPLAYLRRQTQLFALGVTTCAVLVLNAAVCGILSGVYPRYQDRVAWMATLATLLIFAGLFQRSRSANPA